MITKMLTIPKIRMSESETLSHTVLVLPGEPITGTPSTSLYAGVPSSLKSQPWIEYKAHAPGGDFFLILSPPPPRSLMVDPEVEGNLPLLHE